VFAVAIYLPVYLQDVRGNTPTLAGVTMISYSGVWVITSIIVGRLITRTGRYRIFPLIGASLSVIGMALLILVGLHTGRAEVCLMLAIGGCGQGFTASPYLVAAQNSISWSVFGSASAAMNLLRAIGGSLSVSVLGALLASRAKRVIEQRLGASARNIDVSRLTSGVGTGPVHHSAVVHAALLNGLHVIYLVAAIVGLCGVGFAFALEERPLSTKLAH
jgi:MFS family permease